MPRLGHGAPIQPAPCVMKQQFLRPSGCLHVHTWGDQKRVRRGAPRETQGAPGLCELLGSRSWDQHCHFPNGQPRVPLRVPAGAGGNFAPTSPFTTDTIPVRHLPVFCHLDHSRGQSKQKPLRMPRPLGRRHLSHQPPPALLGRGQHASSLLGFRKSALNSPMLVGKGKLYMKQKSILD